MVLSNPFGIVVHDAADAVVTPLISSAVTQIEPLRGPGRKLTQRETDLMGHLAWTDLF